MKRSNPKGKHLPGATPKQQRMYEHIKQAQLDSGASLKEAKRIAAATVRAFAASNPVKIMKRRRSLRRNVEKGAYWGGVFHPYRESKDYSRAAAGEPTSKGAKKTKPKRTTKKKKRVAVSKAIATATRKQRGPAWAAKAKAARERQQRSRARTLASKRKAVGRKKRTAPRKRTVKRSVKRTVKKSAKRVTRRYASKRKSTSAKKVTRRYSPSKRKTTSQKRRVARRNPEASAANTKKWEKLWAAYVKAHKAYEDSSGMGRDKRRPALMRLAKAEKAIAKFDPEALEMYVHGRPRRNPTRRGMRKRYARARREAGASSKYKMRFRRHERAEKRRGEKNPSYTVEAIPKYKDRVKETVSALTRGSAIRKVRKKVPGPKNIYRYRVEKNPTRRGMRKYYAAAKRYSKAQGKVYGEDFGKRVEKGSRKGWRKIKHAKIARRKELESRRRNPSPAEIRKEFAGAVTGEKTLRFPEGTPQGLAKLGKLVSITTEQGTIRPVAGSAWLCSDTRGKLHLGTTAQGNLYDGPKCDFGEVSKVEYEDYKKHLGYSRPTIFFHHLGEKNGIRPRLCADGKGGLVFRGGDYRIGARGIEN